MASLSHHCRRRIASEARRELAKGIASLTPVKGNRAYNEKGEPTMTPPR
jgi:hypothetical protein